MSLSLKVELETWAAALKAYDDQDFEKALDLFSLISDSSKILTNMGLIYATIGEHETAVEHFVAATNLDSYLAIAYFQCGVSNFLLERYDLALLNFQDAYLYLRGNDAINYEQIGLKFKLFSAEVMFNKGLARLNLGYVEEGMANMREASDQKVTDEHGVIDEAIRDRGEGYTVFSIPVGVLYRPSENKLKNAKSKDYLGKAKLVAARDSKDAFTEFTGIKKLQQASGDSEVNSNTKPPALNRSATLPAPSTESDMTHPITLERSKTTFQPTGGVRPNPTAILASRRAQSVSNPANTPPPRPDLSRSNTALGRSNTTRLARNVTASAAVAPLRAKTPQANVGRVAGAGVGSPQVGETSGAGSSTTPTILRNRPGFPKPQDQGAPQIHQQPALQSPPQSFQQSQSVPTAPGVLPLVLPAAPVPSQEGYLSQFYDAYLEPSDDSASYSAVSRSPTSQAEPWVSSPQRQSPISLLYQQPQPQSREQQLPTWMQSPPSPSTASSNTTTGSGLSRTPSRAANAAASTRMNLGAEGNTGLNQNMKAVRRDVSNARVETGTPRRKSTRRPMARRVTTYDDEEGDDGFVAGEYEIEMAKIRIKLHYQGDVRGMTILPTTAFSEFVERVTTKFETSLMGLGMKFTDEEGTKISLRDEGDFELAVETARESAKGRSEGKIEVWCVDL